MKVKSCLLLGSVIAAFATSAAQAQNNNRTPNYTPPRAQAVSFTHVGVRYMFQDLDYANFSCDQDGPNIYGSLDIQDGWYARASFSDVGGSDGCGSTNVQAGAGYHARFDERMEMYASVSFESISPDHAGSESGLILAAGLRGFLTAELEGGVELMHSTTGDGTTAINGLLAYWFNDAVAGTFDLGLGSDVTTFAIGARLNF
jgi:hypothetical protein